MSYFLAHLRWALTTKSMLVLIGYLLAAVGLLVFSDWVHDYLDRAPFLFKFIEYAIAATAMFLFFDVIKPRPAEHLHRPVSIQALVWPSALMSVFVIFLVSAVVILVSLRSWNWTAFSLLALWGVVFLWLYQTWVDMKTIAERYSYVIFTLVVSFFFGPLYREILDKIPRDFGFEILLPLFISVLFLIFVTNFWSTNRSSSSVLESRGQERVYPAFFRDLTVPDWAKADWQKRSWFEIKHHLDSLWMVGFALLGLLLAASETASHQGNVLLSGVLLLFLPLSMTLFAWSDLVARVMFRLQTGQYPARLPAETLARIQMRKVTFLLATGLFGYLLLGSLFHQPSDGAFLNWLMWIINLNPVFAVLVILNLLLTLWTLAIAFSCVPVGKPGRNGLMPKTMVLPLVVWVAFLLFDQPADFDFSPVHLWSIFGICAFATLYGWSRLNLFRKLALKRGVQPLVAPKRLFIVAGVWLAIAVNGCFWMGLDMPQLLAIGALQVLILLAAAYPFIGVAFNVEVTRDIWYTPFARQRQTTGPIRAERYSLWHR